MRLGAMICGKLGKLGSPRWTWLVCVPWLAACEPEGDGDRAVGGTVCPAGTELVEGQCEPARGCPTGTVLRDNRCVLIDGGVSGSDVGPLPNYDAGPPDSPPIDARPSPDRGGGGPVTDAAVNPDARDDAGPPGCLDGDGDGYGDGPECEGPDCDDTDRATHPGAQEMCNGGDDNCDGVPDGCACNPGLQNCRRGQYCAVTDDHQLACLPITADLVSGPGEPCGDGCQPGTHCVSMPGGTMCVTICDPARNLTCPDGEECLSRMRDNPDIGLCREPPAACDIYAQDCDEGYACAPFVRPWGDFDNRCLTEGPNAAGQPCGGDAGQCQRGLLCIWLEEAALCRAICNDELPCGPGETCRGRSSRFDVRFCMPMP